MPETKQEGAGEAVLDEEDELLGEEEPPSEEELKKELEEARAEAEKWKNEYYTSLADTQNLRKSLEEDHRNALRYRSEGFVSALIPALDSFHIALEAVPGSEEAKNYRVGFQYIYNQIQSVLEREGVSEIAPQPGVDYDPSSMHALELDEGGEEGKVSRLLAKGYRLHERMIRPAMVAVYGKKEEEKTEENVPEKDPSEA